MCIVTEGETTCKSGSNKIKSYLCVGELHYIDPYLNRA